MAQRRKSWASVIKDYRLALLRDHSGHLKHEFRIRGGVKDKGGWIDNLSIETTNNAPYFEY